MAGMLNRSEALALIRQHLRALSPPDGEWVVMEAKTIEKPYGWVFYFDSKAYLETGVVSHALAGNGPMIVNRHDGSIAELGTALPTHIYIAEYESRQASSEVSLSKSS